MTSPTSFHFNSELFKLVEKFIIANSKKDVVLDLGTSHRFAKELGFATKYFRKNYYFAMGYNPSTEYGKKSCDINGDILSLPFKSNSASAIICLEVLEHVYNPQLAVDEIFRVLKPGGQLLLTSPFLLPFHGRGEDYNNPDHETYPDFWRFTHQGLQYLCRNFSEIEVRPFSSTINFHIYTLGRLLHLPASVIQKLQILSKYIQSPKLGNATHRHLIIATK